MPRSPSEPLKPPLDRPCNGRETRVAAIFIVLHVGLVVWGDLRHSPNAMEAVDLPAGLYHLEFGRFDLRIVNPPLVRVVAALPVAALGAERDWRSIATGPGRRAEFPVGQDFIAANGEQVFGIFAAARIACLPLTVLGAIVCYCWASDLYGLRSGILAAGLWCFDPTILGHAQTINADVPAAAMGVAAAYAFWRWCRQPEWLNAVIAGTVLGLALLTRTTLWLQLPVLLVVGIAVFIDSRPARSHALQLAAIFGLSIYVVNLGYGFERTGRRLGEFEFISETFGGNLAAPESPGNRFRASTLSYLPILLPGAFVEGVDLQRYDFENRDGQYRSYLRGEWSSHGWWYYYLYGLAVKWPLGTWILVVGAVAAHGHQLRKGRRISLGEWLCLGSGMAILVVVSSQSGFSMHFRYVLPFFPFAFVLMSSAFNVSNRAWIAATWAAFAASVASSLAIHPHGLSYFNELAGGPKNGHAHLVHSSIDWGQDLLEFREWIRKRNLDREITLASTGPTPHALLGVVSGSPPHFRWQNDATLDRSSGPTPGWHAVSATCLREPRYAYFLEFEPVARVGYSINIYHLESEAVNAYRIRSGLESIRPDVR